MYTGNGAFQFLNKLSTLTEAEMLWWELWSERIAPDQWSFYRYDITFRPSKNGETVPLNYSAGRELWTERRLQVNYPPMQVDAFRLAD